MAHWVSTISAPENALKRKSDYENEIAFYNNVRSQLFTEGHL